MQNSSCVHLQIKSLCSFVLRHSTLQTVQCGKNIVCRSMCLFVRCTKKGDQEVYDKEFVYCMDVASKFDLQLSNLFDSCLMCDEPYYLRHTDHVHTFFQSLLVHIFRGDKWQWTMFSTFTIVIVKEP